MMFHGETPCRHCKGRCPLWPYKPYATLGLCSGCIDVVEEVHIIQCKICLAVRDGSLRHNIMEECLGSYMEDLAIDAYIEDWAEFHEYKESL